MQHRAFTLHSRTILLWKWGILMQDYSMLQAFRILGLLSHYRCWWGLSKELLCDLVAYGVSKLSVVKLRGQKKKVGEGMHCGWNKCRLLTFGSSLLTFGSTVGEKLSPSHTYRLFDYIWLNLDFRSMILNLVSTL